MAKRERVDSETKLTPNWSLILCDQHSSVNKAYVALAYKLRTTDRSLEDDVRNMGTAFHYADREAWNALAAGYAVSREAETRMTLEAASLKDIAMATGDVDIAMMAGRLSAFVEAFGRGLLHARMLGVPVERRPQ